MKPAPPRSGIAHVRPTSGIGERMTEAQQRAWLSQQSFQHLARLAAATIPCAGAAQRELGRQLSRFEDEVFVKAMELGATRVQALGLARRATGSTRSVRSSLLLSGELDRARTDVDVLVGTLFTGRSTAGRRVRQHSDDGGAGIARLTWKDAYGCGEPTIDDQHHELFDLGNGLIETSLAHRPSATRVRSALGHLFEHVTRHFADEEAWLAARCYANLQTHRAAHASLLFRAAQLQAKVDLNSPDVGELMGFLANDVVTKHMLASDRDYYSLVAQGRADPGVGTILR